MSTSTFSCLTHRCVLSRAVKSSIRWVQSIEQRWQLRGDCKDLRRLMVKQGPERPSTSDLMTQVFLPLSANCQSTALSSGNTRQELDKMQVMTLASKACGWDDRLTCLWSSQESLKLIQVYMNRCMIDSWRQVRQERESLRKKTSTAKLMRSTLWRNFSKRTKNSRKVPAEEPSQQERRCLETCSSLELARSQRHRWTDSPCSHSFTPRHTSRSFRNSQWLRGDTPVTVSTSVSSQQTRKT